MHTRRHLCKGPIERALAGLLASIIAICAVSCTDVVQSDSPESSDAAVTEGSATVGENTDITRTEEEIQPDLPDADFNGATFTFLTRDWGDANHLSTTIRDVYAEGMNGEVINDAVYERNLYVSEKYNVIIQQNMTIITAQERYAETAHTRYYADMSSYIGAKPVCCAIFTAYALLEKPWWDSNASSSLSISGRLYGTDNAIMLANNDATSAILFNKKLINDYKLENPYDIVRSMEWSIDKMGEMCADFTHDVNGDGIMDQDDAYGFVCYRDAILSFFHSSGGRIAANGEDGEIHFTMGEEKSVNAILNGFELMYRDSTFNLHKELLDGPFADQCYAVAENIFRTGNAMFYWILMHDLEKFRDMEDDFGIVPVPSADPKATGYGSTVNQYHGCLIGLPKTVDEEMAGVIIEALAAISQYTVQKAYYDRAVPKIFPRRGKLRDARHHFQQPGFRRGRLSTSLGNLSWNLIEMTMGQTRHSVAYRQGRQERRQAYYFQSDSPQGLRVLSD